MKLIRKRILPLLLMALLLIAALPMQALAVEGDVGWTQYGRTGHATASGDTVSFPGILPIRLPPFCSARRRTAITAPLRST